MKKADVDVFEKLTAQLDGLHSELTILAKKSPNDAVNNFKLKFINSTLEQCNKFFGVKNRPFADFEKFSMDDLPTNSDVTFIVSQYIECAEKFRADHIYYHVGDWYWRIDGEGESFPSTQTAPPKKIGK
jgi:hypothetical protein